MRFVSHLKLPVHKGRRGDEALLRTLVGRTAGCPSSEAVVLSKLLRSLAVAEAFGRVKSVLSPPPPLPKYASQLAAALTL